MTERQQVEKEVSRRSSPPGRIVYRAILKEGEDELSRPSSALFWSGLAAGLSMGFSMITEGLLRAYLPDVPWRPLVSKFGYSMGFLIVILGRQQLFTENTLTPILPLLLHRDRRTLGNVIRLWGMVLLANLAGAMGVAWVAANTNAFSPDIREAFRQLGQAAMVHGFGTVVLRGIFAGWLIALMVWLLPFAEVARVWVIIFLTYLVGLGGFPHIIAGAVDVFALAASGDKSWGEVWAMYVLPTFIGNVIGGVTLVAALNHAQVVAGSSTEDL